MRATVRRWWLTAYVLALMTAAAVRYVRRARRHRRLLRHVDVWPW